MANAASLTNFSSPALDIGDWLYSIYPRSAPGYLPLNDGVTTYLASSYPTLFGLLNANYKVIPVYTAGTGLGTCQYRNAAYGSSVWVLPGFNDTTGWRTSTDGATWTARTGPDTNAGRSIAFGTGIFVTIAAPNAYTSTDGITWTTRSASLNGSFSCEALFYGGGLFVAMGQNGSTQDLAYTSTNGITWTARTVPAIAGYEHIAYGNSIYVATAGTLWSGSSTTYATSPDGVTWTSRTLPFTATVGGLVFASGKFWMLSSASGTTIYSSTDGISWTSNTISPTIGVNRGLAFDGTIFTAIDNSGNFSVSADGLNWTVKLATGYAGANQLIFGASGVYVAVNNSTAVAKISAPVSTTQFTLPVVTALTNTFTYVKAT